MNFCIEGNLKWGVVCLLYRSDRFLRANSNAIGRFSRVEWANFSVVVDLPTWGTPKIISIGNIACRPNIKKNDVSCVVVQKDVL